MTRFPYLHPDRPLHRFDENTIRVGADDTETLQIQDPDKRWENFLKMCDGTNDLEKLCDFMDESYNESRETILKGLEQLSQANVLTMRSTPFVNDEWHNRFQANLCYFSSEGVDGEKIQRKLQNMTVAVLGVGGGGSQFVMQLVGLGVGNIRLVDGDRVELSNLNRQLPFEMNDIGEFKVEAARRYVANRNPNINIEAWTKKLKSVSDVESVIDGVDWVFCAMDEPLYIAQRLVNKATLKLNIPCIYRFSQRQNG